jgi:hypothetical protein
MVKISFVLAYVIGIMILGFSFAFEFVKYGQTGANKYSFTRNFPYELNQFKVDQPKSYILLITESIGSLLLVCSALLFAINFQNINPTSAYIIFAISTFIIVCFNVLRFVKLANYRAHLLLTSIFVVSNLLLLLLYYFFFTNKDYGYVLQTGVKVTEIVLLLILILFEFFLMLNPSYKNWAKLVKIEADIYSRPKFCYLAILEWGNFLLYLLSFIPLIIVVFF